MASFQRAGVKQAVDLLRTHQLRRENAYLNKEVQELRAEVTRIADKFEEIGSRVYITPELVARVQKIVENAEPRAQRIQAIVEKSNRLAVDTTNSISSLQSRFEGLRRFQQEDASQIRADIRKLEVEKHTISEDHDLRLGKLKEFATEFRKELGLKADASLVVALEARLNTLGEFRPMVRTSLAGEIVMNDHIPETRVQNPGPIINVCSRKSKRKRSTGPSERDERTVKQRGRNVVRDIREQPETFSAPEDIDLDERVGAANRKRQVTRESEPNNVSSIVKDNLDFNIKNSDSLKQNTANTWEQYYTQSRKLFDNLQTQFEENFIRRFVDGLTDGKQRLQCQRWLEVNGWNWGNVNLFKHFCSSTVPPNNPIPLRKDVREQSICRLLRSEQVNDDISISQSPRDSIQRNEETLAVEANDKDISFAKHNRGTIDLVDQRSSDQIVEKANDGKSDSGPTSLIEGGRSGEARSLIIRLKYRSNAMGIQKPLASETSIHSEHMDQLPNLTSSSLSQPHHSICSSNGQNTRGISENFNLDEKEDSVLIPETPAEGFVKNRIVPRLVHSKSHQNHRSKPTSQELPSLPAVDMSIHPRNRLRGKGRQLRKHRVKLGPPPEIPILPTSSDG